MTRILFSRLFTLCLAATLLPVATPAHGAPIIARFTHGGSSASTVTSEVDAWSGKTGDGWTSIWNRSSTTTEVISAASPIWGANPRLQITPSSATSTSGHVNRIYDPAYVTPAANAPIVISFDLSIDDLGDFLNTASNHFFLAQSNSASTNYTSNTNWLIYGYGGTDPESAVAESGPLATAMQGQWNLMTGGNSTNSYIPTGVALAEGVLYSFTLTLDRVNQSYSVLLTDGTTTFQSDPLSFYNTNGNFLTRLVFSQNYQLNQNAIYSIGNIRIVPEPSSLALIAGAVAGIAALHRRRHKGLR
ncbi:MAG TPA: PEP-CTERM sorting domain-containing protein [Chthoniobacteraceae bacterium]|nr:PEP-CTERM sorting domain-containing protein [Chthoniobacteraceae bacterium]